MAEVVLVVAPMELEPVVVAAVAVEAMVAMEPQL